MRIIILSIFLLLSSTGLPYSLQAQTNQLRIRMMALTYYEISKAYGDSEQDTQKLIKKIENFLDLYENDIPNSKEDNKMRKKAHKMLEILRSPTKQRQAVNINQINEYPELKGGMSFLQKQIRYPAKARMNNIEGTIRVRFHITKKGDVENVKTLNSLGYGLDEEAIRVAKLAKFKPGKIDGKPVRVKFTIPLQFNIK